MTALLKFELLCIDQENKVKFKSPKNFILALSIIESLWQDDSVRLVNDSGINDKVQNIKLEVQPFDTSKIITGEISSAYYIIVEGKFQNLEPFREKLIDELKDLGFSHRRILIDEVSNQIAVDIYPLLNSIENLLRRYIIKFFTTKIGTDWWSIAVSKEDRDKAGSRKTNEVVFTKTTKVVTDVTLLNFDQLGKIIYSQSSIFTNTKDITKDIFEKIKMATDLESLKQELLEGNYVKYFKDTFEQKDFEKQWKELTFIRNKVAHNNYFLERDKTLSFDLHHKLTQIINDADNTIDTLTLSIADKEAVIKVIDEVEIEREEKQLELRGIKNEEESEKNNSPKAIIVDKPLLSSLNIVSEEKLLFQLNKCSTSKEFVCLKYFVRDYLGSEGYSFNSSYALINLLADKGKIDIYAVPNPYGEYKTTAIRLIN